MAQTKPKLLPFFFFFFPFLCVHAEEEGRENKVPNQSLHAEEESPSQQSLSASTLRRFQMKEALQMHLKEQNRLQDQLEAQRCLKIKIELQGRYLEKIVEEYRDSNYSNCKSTWPLPPALPSLMELSESHSTKCGSDSEEISQSIHRIPYRQEKLLFGDVKRQIAAGHEITQLGFSYDESHDSSLSNSSPTVSHPFKRSRVGKDVLQPSLGVHL